MAFTYIRHQLHLHRQKATVAAILILCLFGATQAQAQKKIKGENKPGYDEKRVHYGFYLGAAFNRYNVEHSQDYVNQLTNGFRVNAKTSPGFQTGLVLNVRLFEYLDARFVPGVGFYGRTIEFDNIMQSGESEVKRDDVTISSTMVELPFLLKYRAKRRGNFRMYFVGGVKPSVDLGSMKDTSTGDKLQSEKYDLALEYGVGLDIFYPYFKFAPELRFSHGLLDQYNSIDNTANPHYSGSIQKMKNHSVSLIFFFE